jgi:hypothetical protein
MEKNYEGLGRFDKALEEKPCMFARELAATKSMPK